MLLAIWIAALTGIALWTLAAWGLHSLLLSDPARMQDLKPLIEQIPHRESIDLWLPGWQTLLQFLIDLTQGLIAGLNNAAPWFAWVLWAVGVTMMLLVAGVVTLLVVVVRKETASSQQRRLPAGGR